MKGVARVLLTLGALVGCAAGGAKPCLAPSKPAAAAASTHQLSLPAAPPLTYVLAPHGLVEGGGNRGLARLLRLAPRSVGDDGGFLADGARFRVDAWGRFTTAKVSPLVDGIRIPTRFGGGFLFSSGDSLFRAKDFLAELEPFFFADGAGVQRVSFGPRFVLVRSNSGAAWSLSFPEAAPAPLPVAGLLDVAALDDGRAAALLEDGSARFLHGPSWDAVAAPNASLPFLQVEQDGQSIWFVDARGARWALGQQGALERLPPVPEAAFDPRVLGLQLPADWPLQQTPLERAVTAGVMLDERVALVEVAGRFVKIDTRLGTVVATTEPVVSGDFDRAEIAPNTCQLQHVGTDVVGVCGLWKNSVVIEDAASASPRVRFDYFGDRKFIGGPDLLYSTGPCASDTPKPGVICVREPGRDWAERQLSWLPPPPSPDAQAEPDDEPSHEPALWTSTAAGSPAAVFGVSSRYYFVDLANPVARWLPLDNRDTCFGCGSRGAIERRNHINARGRLVDGMPQHLIQVNRALLQRTDGASSFQATSPAPLMAPESAEPACTEVGCQLGPLLRLGWDAPAPGTPFEAEAGATPLPRVQGARWLQREQARLSCQRVGEPQPLPGNPAEDRRRPEPPPSKTAIRDWFWQAPTIELLAPTAGPSETSPPPQPRLGSSSGGLPTVAVSDLSRLRAVGLLASDHRTGVWHAYGDGRFETYEQMRASDRFSRLVAATRLPNGDVAMLTQSSEEKLTRVRISSRGSLTSTWLAPLGPAGQLQTQEDRESTEATPANETLALGPKNELGILRLPRGDGFATAASGALLLRKNAGLSLLAPWSTLEPGASAACAKPAVEWRAVLKLGMPWLRLTGLQNANLDRGSITAAVRWRSDRVCVDWLQVGDLQLDSAWRGQFTENVRDSSAETRHLPRFRRWRTVRQRLRCAAAASAGARP